MRRILLLASAIVFVDTMFFAVLTPLLPHYAHHFRLSKSGAGVLAAAYPVGVFLGGIPSGLVAARVGVKPTAIAGMLLVAVNAIVFGFADSIVLLDAARLAQGIASAFAWTAALSWLVSVAPAERRGAVIGKAIGVAIGGALFGPVLGGIASIVGTGPAFTGVAAVSLAVVAWAVATKAPPPRREQSVVRLWAALLDRPILAGLWLVALPGLLFGTTTVLVPLRLSHLGFGAVAIGAVFLAAAALEAGVSPPAGRLADARGHRFPLAIALAASAAGAVILPWPTDAGLLALVAVLASAAFGVFWVPAMTMLADAADRVRLDPVWVFALMNLAWAPGQALGAAAGGAVAKATTDAVPYLALAGVCGITLVALLRVERPHPDRV
jgi:MFS family permease